MVPVLVDQYSGHVYFLNKRGIPAIKKPHGLNREVSELSGGGITRH
jgi:hypothetical protein